MRALLAVAMTLVLALPARAQAPNDSWRTIRTEHFRITYQDGLERLAQRAGAHAERAYAALAADLVEPPRGDIDIIVTDHIDATNGSATPLPSNRITVFAKPPIDLNALSEFNDWMELVVTHELTHIFHMDRAPRFGRALRSVFGRLPVAWPVFPVLGAPSWNLEGLAVNEESRLTGAGRIEGTYHEMIVRTAVLERRFDSLGRISNTSPIFPGDERIYVYGSLFLDYITERFGQEAQRRIIEKTVSGFPGMGVGRVGSRATGESFEQLYAEWHARLLTRYTRLADSLRARGLTPSVAVTQPGYFALNPRVSPDGRTLAYVSTNGKDIRHIRLVDVESRQTRRLARYSGEGPPAWTPDGTAMFVTQLEYADPFHLYADLYRIDAANGRRERITHSARIEHVDVSSTGELVGIRNDAGRAHLVRIDASGSARVLLRSSEDTLYSFPRWSPDAQRIALVRWTSGGSYDIIVVDADGSNVRALTSDVAIDANPAWDPTGAFVLFSSDRSGISNIYAADTQSARAGLIQLTNVLSGAFQPEVSRDGRTLYFVLYSARGYAIHRTPLDLANETPRLAALEVRRRGMRDTVQALAARTANDVDTSMSPAREYNPLRSLRPYYWAPFVFGGESLGTFIGAATSGIDLIRRHSFAATAAAGTKGGRWLGYASYTFTGLANPILSTYVARSWDREGSLVVNDDERAVTSREDVALLGATIQRTRLWSVAAVTAAAELSRRRYFVEGTPPVQLVDEVDDFTGAAINASFSNVRRPILAFSREDGISLNATARRRWDRSPVPSFDGSYDEAITSGSAYKALDLPGFAHHVLALHGAARVRTGPGATTFSAGGSSGTGGDPLGIGATLGSTRVLPVRGYSSGARRGTRGWAASTEYRVPIALVGESLIGMRTLFIDRITAAAFVDAGNAWIPNAQRPQPMLGAGAEIALDLAALGSPVFKLRTGIAFPRTGSTKFYAELGPSF